MRLPENLLPDDVVDVAMLAGFAVDRRNVTRALEQTPVKGVVPSPRRGVAWVIPRAALVDVLAACLQRRAARKLAPQYLPAPPLADCRLDAARRMLAAPGLDALVPRRLAREVRDRDAAAAERRRLARERAEREARERDRAEREEERARIAAERRRVAAWTAYHEAGERHRKLSQVYGICVGLARDDVGGCEAIRLGTMTPRWREDWPHDRPSWWMPPPGMLEAFLKQSKYSLWTQEESYWRQWWPGYVPGRPWPFRDDAYTAPERPSCSPPSYR